MKKLKQLHCLNTLIRIHNDRLAMYTNATLLLQQFPVALDAAPFFAQLSRECLQAIQEITKEIKALGGHSPEEPSLLGKMMLIGMEMHAIFSPNPVRAIINCCGRMDKRAIRLYNHSIRNTHISDNMRQRLLHQRITLESSANLMESYQGLQSSYMRQQGLI